MRRLYPVIAAVLLAASASPVLGSSGSYPKILLNLMSPTAKNSCGRAGVAPTCSNIVCNGDLAPAAYYAYVLITDGDATEGIAGVQFGIEYDAAVSSGVDIFSWTVCGPLQFPMAGWPASGTGNLLAWDSVNQCQRYEPGGPGTGVTAVVGYFYVSAYSADDLRITPRQVDGAAKTGNCNSAEFLIAGSGGTPVPWPLGYASFSQGGVTPGYNPCGESVLGAPECNIIGPDGVPPMTTATYEATSSIPGASFSWSIHGNGSIVGPSNGSTVTVGAGGTGSLTLYVSVVVPTGTSRCNISVAIVDTPTCSIFGPSLITAAPDTIMYWAQVAALSPATLDWSVTGDGVLVGTGLVNGYDRAYVQATGAGAFTVNLLVTDANGATTSCQWYVTVTGGSGCSIAGADSAFSEIVERYTPEVSGSSYDWSISGNGEISTVFPDGEARVIPGAPGFFTLRLTVNGATESVSCDKIVQVLPYSPGPPGNQSSAKLMVHLVSAGSTNACLSPAAEPRCSEINSAGDLFPATYNAFLLLGDGNASAGVMGFQCGIQYDGKVQSGVDIFDWHACCDQTIGEGWPASGSGAGLSWNQEHCQRNEPGGAGTGVVAPAGYFYLAAYSPDVLRLTTYPLDHVFEVYDCAIQPTVVEGGGVHQSPYPLGYASFSAGATVAGSVPCSAAIPVIPTTWSRIKTLYKGD